MSTGYVVALYTRGTFARWVTRVLDDVEQAQSLVADPPPGLDTHQDELRVFELGPVTR